MRKIFLPSLKITVEKRNKLMYNIAQKRRKGVPVTDKQMNLGGKR